jgi:hypothetical protein
MLVHVHMAWLFLFPGSYILPVLRGSSSLTMGCAAVLAPARTALLTIRHHCYSANPESVSLKPPLSSLIDGLLLRDEARVRHITEGVSIKKIVGDGVIQRATGWLTAQQAVP